MRAKKSFGQHFLTNESYAERIADALQWTDQYNDVLEVGPGQGMLTKYLLQKPFDLKVVEADRDMVSFLEEHYPVLSPNIISANFLKVSLKDHFSESFAIVGNYPYNISSQILIKTIEYREQVPEMVGMFQKEVADRVVAPPGDKTYGVISILVQAFYEAQYLFTVKRGNFNPPPKVQSAVIRLARLATPAVSEELWPTFRKVVKVSFGQRRKMLRNTLKPFLPAEKLQNEMFQLRPERLSVAQFVDLAQMVFAEEQASA